MSFSWHSYHRNPERRRRDRRAGAASERMREALDIPITDAPVLSKDALILARQRRGRYATRNELPAWMETRTGRVLFGLAALLVGLGITVVLLGSILSILMGGS